MSYKTFKALLILANEQGFKLETIADFTKFATHNYSKITMVTVKTEAERLIA